MTASHFGGISLDGAASPRCRLLGSLGFSSRTTVDQPDGRRAEQH
jgi:hypothetical protein